MSKATALLVIVSYTVFMYALYDQSQKAQRAELFGYDACMVATGGADAICKLNVYGEIPDARK